MSAYLKLGDIQGEATEAGHTNWIVIEHLSMPITRSIPSGAVDTQRTKGTTTLGDITIVRQLDKSSPKLAEAAANGKFFPDAEIDFCTTVNGKDTPYLTYKLKNVIITSYAFEGNKMADPHPTEDITLGYTDIEGNYSVVDPKTGTAKGNVPWKYSVSGRS